MSDPAPPAQPLLPLDALSLVGEGLCRPECVLTTPQGDLFTPDWRGGVARTRPDGTTSLLRGRLGPDEPPLRPNGIAREPDGSFLLADLSDERAGVWRLRPSGAVEPFLLDVDGEPLPPTNFVLLDPPERVWITVSTRLQPRARDYRPDAATGFVVLADRRGARIVADGLGYTNECRVHPSGRWLYVNETFGRRLTRFRIGADGKLSDQETVATFGTGTFPDGLAFDAQGHAWITSIVSNRVLRIAPDGAQRLVLEDIDADHIARVEAAFQGGTMDRPHLDAVHSRRLQSISSIAFSPDGRTAYLGCLLGDRVATFDCGAWMAGWGA